MLNNARIAPRGSKDARATQTLPEIRADWNISSMTNAYFPICSLRPGTLPAFQHNVTEAKEAKTD